jgi:hypothetical protein
MHYGIAGPPQQHHHDNSPKSRKRRYAARQIEYRIDKKLYQKPPFTAVRALLFSTGYRMEGSVNDSQKTKWLIARRHDWVPFEVTKAGVACTRWVRAEPGERMEVSDGSKVNRNIVLRYAMMRRKYKRPAA